MQTTALSNLKVPNHKMTANKCLLVFFQGILYPNGSKPLKWREIGILFLALFSTALSVTMLFPFLPAMVKHFGKTEEETGYYAGIIASAMFCGRFLSSYFWGVLADMIGRRPVIIISVLLMGLSTFLFGLSTSVAMAIGTRLLIGLANGVLGTAKAMISELCDVTNQSLGMSTITCAFTSGMIIGPALGGFLSETGKKYPDTFPKGSFFDKYPFLLPCLLISILQVFSAIIAYKWLPETLKLRKKKNDEKGSVVVDGSLEKEKDKNTKNSTDYQEVNWSENMKNEHTIAKPNEPKNTLNVNDTSNIKIDQETLNNEPAMVSVENSLDKSQNSSRESTDTLDIRQSLSSVASDPEDAKGNSEKEFVDLESKHGTQELPSVENHFEKKDENFGKNTSDTTPEYVEGNSGEEEFVDLKSKQGTQELPSSVENHFESKNEKFRRNTSEITQVVSYECKSGTGTVHFEPVEEDSEKDSAAKRHQSCCRCLASYKKQSNLWKILRNRNAVLVLGIYSVFSFAAMGLDELVNLWTATSPRLGGLGFSTDAIGTFHLIIGIAVTVMQPTVLPKIERKLGCLLNLQVSTMIGMFFCVVMPCIRIFYNRSSVVWPILLISLTIRNIATCNGYLLIALLTNNSINSDLVCSMNGLAIMTSSLLKSFGPIVGGSLYAWSLSTGKHIGFPFNINLAFIVFGLVLLLSTFVSCLVSESLNEPKKNDKEMLRKSVEKLMHTQT